MQLTTRLFQCYTWCHLLLTTKTFPKPRWNLASINILSAHEWPFTSYLPYSAHAYTCTCVYMHMRIHAHAYTCTCAVYMHMRKHIVVTKTCMYLQTNLIFTHLSFSLIVPSLALINNSKNKTISWRYTSTIHWSDYPSKLLHTGIYLLSIQIMKRMIKSIL